MPVATKKKICYYKGKTNDYFGYVRSLFQLMIDFVKQHVEKLVGIHLFIFFKKKPNIYFYFIFLEKILYLLSNIDWIAIEIFDGTTEIDRVEGAIQRFTQMSKQHLKNFV